MIGLHCPIDLANRDDYWCRLGGRKFDAEGFERGERINGYYECPKCGVWWPCVEEPDMWDEGPNGRWRRAQARGRLRGRRMCLVRERHGGGVLMAHTCHATGCAVKVPPEMFACKRHWFALPKRLRDRIWSTYRPGQCDDWDISHEYADAAREAVRYLAAKDGVEPDTSVYDMLDPAKDEQ